MSKLSKSETAKLLTTGTFGTMYKSQNYQNKQIQMVSTMVVTNKTSHCKLMR